MKMMKDHIFEACKGTVETITATELRAHVGE
jgi:hypothetical protein